MFGGAWVAGWIAGLSGYFTVFVTQSRLSVETERQVNCGYAYAYLCNYSAW